MADLRLIARAPLAHRALPMRLGMLDDGPGVEIRTIPEMSLHLLIERKGQAEAVRDRAATADLSLRPNAATFGSNGISVIWAGPDQWLVAATPQGHEAAARFVARCRGLCTVVDQSDARAVIAVSGARARDCLAKGFPIDLHPRAFRTGDAALTSAAGVSAHIWQVDDTPTYHIAVPRSYAEGFWHWLTDSAAEYGVEVTA